MASVSVYEATGDNISATSERQMKTWRNRCFRKTQYWIETKKLDRGETRPATGNHDDASDLRYCRLLTSIAMPETVCCIIRVVGCLAC